MENKRPKKPSVVFVEENRQWDFWAKGFADSSSKSKVQSLKYNWHFGIFACASSGNKLYFLLLSVFEFLGKSSPIQLSGEILPKNKDARLAAKCTDVEPVPKDGHS